jgi:hypothetical protein
VCEDAWLSETHPFTSCQCQLLPKLMGCACPTQRQQLNLQPTTSSLRVAVLRLGQIKKPTCSCAFSSSVSCPPGAGVLERDDLHPQQATYSRCCPWAPALTCACQPPAASLPGMRAQAQQPFSNPAPTLLYTQHPYVCTTQQA